MLDDRGEEHVNAIKLAGYPDKCGNSAAPWADVDFHVERRRRSPASAGWLRSDLPRFCGVWVGDEVPKGDGIMATDCSRSR